MNLLHPIVHHRSVKRRTRFAAPILLRGASRRAERVFNPSLPFMIDGPTGSVPVSPTASPNESRT